MPPATLFVGPLDRVLYFRTMPAFEHLSSTELAAIAQHAQEEIYPAGTALLRPGEPAEAIYLVVDGLVSLSQGQQPPEQLGPGEAVGFLELLARRGEEMHAHVDRDTLALRLDWEAQLDVCEQHFGILLGYLRYLSLRTIQEAGTPAPRGRDESPPPDHDPLGPLHFVRRVLALRQCTAFPTGAMDALAELARHVTRVDYSAGTAIWRAGDPGDHFLALLTGRATCGNQRQGAVVRRRPDILGMHETLAGIPRWYDATATDNLTALKIEIEPFLDILEDHFDLAIEFTSLMARGVLEGRRQNGEGRTEKGG